MSTCMKALGLEPNDRAIVVHVDDLGMSIAANEGGIRAMEATATCGSVMVPCPAFEEIASVGRRRSDLDLGVHLTLNAEYDDYRWDPVSDQVPSLVSPDGGMWRSTAETVANATPEDVDRELRAQVDAALEAGIDVTHIDSHMGTVFDPKFAEIYFQLARDYKLPAFVPRPRRENSLEHTLEALPIDMINAFEAAGFPIFEHFDSNSLEFEPGTGLEHNKARVDGLGPGLSYLMTHCARGGPDLMQITDDWRQRDEEHRIYSDGSMAAVFEHSGAKTLGMRELRSLVPGR